MEHRIKSDGFIEEEPVYLKMLKRLFYNVCIKVEITTNLSDFIDKN